MKSISEINPNITRDYILKSNESVHFDRKSIWISLTKLANCIIAMANAEGWIIVLWINDWVVEDLKTLNSIKFNDFKQIWINYVKPPCNFDIEDVEIDGKMIFIYHIEPDYERLFCRKDNEDVYLRVWDETRKLNRDETRKLEYDKTIRKFEDEICVDFDENDFNMEVINRYKDNILKFEWDYKKLLINRHLAIFKKWKYNYKNSAVLLFAKDPEKYFASSSIRYVRYNWVSMTTWTNLNIVKDERFVGPIPTIIELSKQFLKNVLKDYYFLDTNEWKFVKIPEYPEDAWLEWIINALTHRSYNLQWNTVLIKHYDDRLEISNSWPLPSFVTVKNITSNRYARNPRIARVLSDFWYIRELNEWVKRIFESMKKYFLAQPEYKNENNIVTLILKNNATSDNRVVSEKKRLKIESELNKLDNTSKQIILHLSQTNRVVLKQLVDIMNIQEKTIMNTLKYLLDKELIQKHTNSDEDLNVLYSL